MWESIDFKSISSSFRSYSAPEWDIVGRKVTPNGQHCPYPFNPRPRPSSLDLKDDATWSPSLEYESSHLGPAHCSMIRNAVQVGDGLERRFLIGHRTGTAVRRVQTRRRGGKPDSRLGHGRRSSSSACGCRSVRVVSAKAGVMMTNRVSTRGMQLL